MSLLVFIVMLGVLIAVHEWGHFIAAKKSGVNVEEFAIGFGPTLWSSKKDGTDFKLCAIPLGGYVKMAGDERHSCEGKSGEFFSASVGVRSLIVVMGPVINFIFALLCFYCVAFLGQVDMEATFDNLEKRVSYQIGHVVPDSPAQKAGVKEGDLIVRIDNVAIENWTELQQEISSSTREMINLTVRREEKSFSLKVSPESKNIQGQEVRVIGISPKKVLPTKKDVVVLPSEGLFLSAVGGAKMLGDITVKTYTALYEMFTGQRSPKEMAGPIGIYSFVDFAVSFFQFGATIGFSFLLYVVGIISASLAIFNLLPLVPLDGGHLLLFAIEKIRGKELSPKVDEWITKFGIGIFLMLFLFVFYVDFERIGLIAKVTELIGQIKP